jgi:hypothetical protein
MQRPGDPWQVMEARWGLVFVVYLLGLAAAALGVVPDALGALSGGILGYVLAALLVGLWGERTRPKPTAGWALVTVLWLALLAYFSFDLGMRDRAFWVASTVSLPVALSMRHESGSSSMLLIGGVVWVALFASGRIFQEAGDRLMDAEGVWISLATVTAIVAGTLEHERLSRQKGAGTPVYWTVFRLAFVGVWTLVVLALREEVQWGRLFVVFGADLTGQAGQMLLLGLLVAALVVAAYAFRPAEDRTKDDARGPQTGQRGR